MVHACRENISVQLKHESQDWWCSLRLNEAFPFKLQIRKSFRNHYRLSCVKRTRLVVIMASPLLTADHLSNFDSLIYRFLILGIPLIISDYGSYRFRKSSCGFSKTKKSQLGTNQKDEEKFAVTNGRITNQLHTVELREIFFLQSQANLSVTFDVESQIQIKLRKLDSKWLVRMCTLLHLVKELWVRTKPRYSGYCGGKNCSFRKIRPVYNVTID